MINLDGVTLFSVDCINPEKAVIALKESIAKIKFNKVVIFSDRQPINLTDEIEYINIRSINSLVEYSTFMIKDLVDYITTDFCLSIHSDGWIINPNNWSEDFLKYDYIGAPWPATSEFLPHGEKYRVGNGGVSIRSRKLMEVVRDNVPNISYHEDTLITHIMRELLEYNNITFAPLSIAKKFSYELECKDLGVSFDDVFAFHGKSHTTAHKEKMKFITSLYYRDIIPKLSNQKIQNWLQTEAGSQDPSTFFGSLKGNLNLQQIPHEYVNLLDFLRNRDIKSYLELGVGNGGSFFTNSLFIGDKCNKFHAVDNISYANTSILQTESKIISKVNLLKNLFEHKNIKFFNSTTDEFFIKNRDTYDCIFIDADHSYEGVRKDYENSIKILNKNGVIIFHDIGNNTTGVEQLWNEIKNKASTYFEYLWKPDYVDYYNCGIGIYIL